MQETREVHLVPQPEDFMGDGKFCCNCVYHSYFFMGPRFCEFGCPTKTDCMEIPKGAKIMSYEDNFANECPGYKSK